MHHDGAIPRGYQRLRVFAQATELPGHFLEAYAAVAFGLVWEHQVDQADELRDDWLGAPAEVNTYVRAYGVAEGGGVDALYSYQDPLQAYHRAARHLALADAPADSMCWEAREQGLLTTWLLSTEQEIHEALPAQARERRYQGEGTIGDAMETSAPDSPAFAVPTP